MDARAGVHARTTADADATWRTDATQLRATLDQAARTDLGDHFHFLIGAPTGLGGGARGRSALSDPASTGRSAVRTDSPGHQPLPGQPGPVETLHLRNHSAFAGLPTVVVPAISAAQQLTVKLHAYTCDYGAGENTGTKHLYDMQIIAADLLVSPLAELAEVLRHHLRAPRHQLAAPLSSTARQLVQAVGRICPRPRHRVHGPDRCQHRARRILEPPGHHGWRLALLGLQHVDLGPRKLGE